MDTTLHNSKNEVDMAYISTSRFPPAETVQALVDEAYNLYRTNDDGANAAHYPALADVPRHLFGLCVAEVSGRLFTAGDADYPFSMMSVAKPFTFALVCASIGVAAARSKLGLNATGLPFNSIMAVELHPQRLTNPMVNSGALATVSLAPGDTAAAKWAFIRDGLSRFAGRPLSINEEMFASASVSNFRNRAIARLLYDYKRLYFDPEATTDVYTRQSCLNVTARDLAVMGATLANGGVNPLTGEQVIGVVNCERVLAVMATAGMYESSGDWLFDVGLPAKSGVGGGLITVAPGKGGFGAFSPPLDAAGNSVRGQLAARFLSNRLAMNLFASLPAPRRAAARADG
ncbi:MAG: glutaminase A [Candidatus Promineofilum sp.]|nr:glutaminase A [Promineifilum sp.]